MAERVQGTVKWFNADKGYGFIKPDDGGPDIFVHITAVQASGLTGLAENQKVADRKIARQEAELQSLADRIAGKTLTFEARSGEGGRLYGSITNADIAEKLGEIVGAEIDRRKIVLDESIRTTGEHTVTVHLVGKLRPEITVVVHGDEVEEETAEATEAEEAVAE